MVRDGIPNPRSIPRFFFSFASEDADKDGLLFQFAKELRAAVKAKLQLEDDDAAGFVSASSIRSGQTWAEALGQALQSSRVLVAMVSDAYLRSAACGKELAVFLSRRELAADQNPTVIVPVIWDHRKLSAELPVSLTQFQLPTTVLPPPHAVKGARAVMLGPDGGHRAMIEALVDVIIQGAEFELPPLPPERIEPWDALPNALLPDAPKPAPSSTVESLDGYKLRASPHLNPFEIRFVHLNAAMAAEFPAARTNRGSYVPGPGWYWRPFAPRSLETVGQMVARASLQYRSEDAAVTPDLVSYLQDSEGEKAVILVVDAWASLATALRELLERIDRARISNYAVLVIEDSLDQETVIARETLLTDGLRLAFPVSFAQARPEYFCRGIGSIDQVDESVRRALTSLSDQMAERAAARMRIQGSPLPMLAGRAA